MESTEPGELDNNDCLDSRDGFILESNFSNQDVNSFERVLCGATGKCKPIDFCKLRPYFLWKAIGTIKKMFAVTTQFMETVWYNTPRLPLRRHFKSRAPFMNVRRLNEGYATDTIFSNCKAYDGSSCAKVYVGCTSKFVYIEGMATKSQMPRTLLNFIRQWGESRNSCGEIRRKKKIPKLLMISYEVSTLPIVIVNPTMNIKIQLSAESSI